MARFCVICEKQTTFGGNKKHRRGSSGGGGQWRFKSPNTKRSWKPNIRKVIVEDDNGMKIKIDVCMKCYKKIRNS